MIQQDSVNLKQELGFKPVVIALGSNIEPREERMIAAIRLLDKIPQTEVWITSACYKSAPWGVTDQAEFLNAAVLIQTKLSPIELLNETREIELLLGKEYRRHWGPREIDLDLIDFAGEIVDLPELKLPHPGAKDRPFVLIPMQDLKLETFDLQPMEWTDAANFCRNETTIYSDAGIWKKEITPWGIQSIVIPNEESLREFTKALVAVVEPGLVIALDGNLGSGKTTFTRHFCEALGIQESVSSPSYTLCHEYEGSIPVIHWDFYRLENCDDLESTGFEIRQEAITIVEWASLFPDSLPANTLRITLERFPYDENSRVLRLNFLPGEHMKLRIEFNRFMVPLNRSRNKQP